MKRRGAKGTEAEGTEGQRQKAQMQKGRGIDADCVEGRSPMQKR